VGTARHVFLLSAFALLTPSLPHSQWRANRTTRLKAMSHINKGLDAGFVYGFR
jgi:hypothetical protein